MIPENYMMLRILRLKNILAIKELPTQLDATDGLAAALCHYYQKIQTGTSNSYKDWSDFIRKNPDRLKG